MLQNGHIALKYLHTDINDPGEMERFLVVWETIEIWDIYGRHSFWDKSNISVETIRKEKMGKDIGLMISLCKMREFPYDHICFISEE